MNFTKIDCTQYVSDPTTEFMASGFNGNQVASVNISAQIVQSVFNNTIQPQFGPQKFDPANEITFSGISVADLNGNRYEYEFANAIDLLLVLPQSYTPEECSGYFTVLNSPNTNFPQYLYTVDMRNINDKYFMNYVLPEQRDIINYDLDAINLASKFSPEFSSVGGSSNSMAYRDNYVYYYMPTTIDQHIWRIKTDGSDASFVNVTNLNPSSGFTVVFLDDTLYMSGFVGNDMYRIDSAVPWVAGSTVNAVATGSGTPFNNTGISAGMPCLPRSVANTFNSKSVDKSVAGIGDEITYTINVTNSSAAPLTDMYLLDVLPAGLEFVASSLTVNSVPNSADPTVAPGALLGLSLDAGDSYAVILIPK